MKLKFTKMQGAGNDFVVLDAIHQDVRMTAELAKRLADRHFGVGCDQVLLVEKDATGEADFRYRIFNADGGEVGQCGNGARCFVRFVHDKGLSGQPAIRVLTQAGVIAPRLEPDGQVSVDMGAPVFEPELIPFMAAGNEFVQALEVGDTTVRIAALSMGNPHAVQVVSNVAAAPVGTQGALIERHPRFPDRVNAGYMQIVDRHHIRLRVWERGAGETLACGTGACAAAVAGIRQGLLDSPVEVSMRGGKVRIEWTALGNDLNSGLNGAVRMTGPAVTVFEGEIEVDG